MLAKTAGLSPDSVFKALGNPTRIALVRTLMEGERCVCDLVQVAGMAWSTTSKHLDVLRAAGVISSDKRGQKIFYRLELACVAHFIDCLDQARLGQRATAIRCNCA